MSNHPTAVSASSACRHLLSAVRTALNIPAPATVLDEAGHYAVLAARVSLARGALARVLRSPEPGPDAYEAESDALMAELAGYPPAYGHHPLGT